MKKHSKPNQVLQALSSRLFGLELKPLPSPSPVYCATKKKKKEAALFTSKTSRLMMLVLLCCIFVTALAQTSAFLSQADGGQGYTEALCNKITVTNAISVTSLGAFDNNADGLASLKNVAFYSVDPTLGTPDIVLATTTVPAGTVAPL
jgi:hypothetical protein